MPENSIIPEIHVYSPEQSKPSKRTREKRRLGSGLMKWDGEQDEKNGNEGWMNPFQMRTVNLANFPSNSSGNRLNYRTVVNRARIGITTSAAKSLNILRNALQSSMNEEINEIIQKYLQNFFRPAVENIKHNLGTNSVSEQHVQTVCRQILDEAKKMYFASQVNRSNSPNGHPSEEYSDHEIHEKLYNTIHKRKILKETDSESESGSINTLLKPGRKKKQRMHGGRGRSTPVKEPIKREGPKWNPNRLSTETKFVLGSKANKALGFGSTRGRLYTKHADLFRYIGDQEDKQWLHERGLMPLAGGRAYLLIKEDIEDLINSEEYENAPGVNVNDMGAGFSAPESMIIKMRSIMDAMRTGDVNGGPSRNPGKKDEIANTSQETALNMNTSITPPSSNITSNESSLGRCNSNFPSIDANGTDSRGISPAEDIEYVNSTEMLAGNASPFSIGGTGLSPTGDNNQVSSIGSDISCNFNDILPD